ncbi:glycine-rich protein 5-like [Folsomia candida]|uniref:glycine-rich protein 5-like n=1 Tax=Folsomia candida TaxID=158441 RepID=UPI000B8FB293|nr:glycine-rich protein 5-like [Folsomia candida]
MESRTNVCFLLVVCLFTFSVALPHQPIGTSQVNNDVDPSAPLLRGARQYYPRGDYGGGYYPGGGIGVGSSQANAAAISSSSSLGGGGGFGGFPGSGTSFSASQEAANSFGSGFGGK